MSSASNTKKGKIGEDLAVSFLVKNGYQVLRQNYRFKRSEIDIIAQIGDLLVFVEVKFRKSLHFGLPEESISEKKIEMVKEASDHYVYETDWHKNIRFDVVSILQMGGKTEFLHLEDAF